MECLAANGGPMESSLPEIRVQTLGSQPLRQDGEFVLYWMTSQRRVRWNFALDRALEIAADLGKPILIFEALRADYPWASPRIHRFVLEGMVVNRDRCRDAGVAYYPYVEPEAGAGQGLLTELSKRSCAVVTDEFPCFFLPGQLSSAARQVEAHFEVVEGNGILPIRAGERAWPSAYSFRRHLQRTLPEHLSSMPHADPLDRASLPALPGVPASVLERWPATDLDRLNGSLPPGLKIEGTVPPVAYSGGSASAEDALQSFLDEKLPGYSEFRNRPTREATTGLSPYLHFGHISAHEIVHSLLEREEWEPGKLSAKVDGRRNGWWGVTANTEALLDQVVTWRELGYGFCHYNPEDFSRFESLPDWAQRTLEGHSADNRDPCYGLEQLESAETYDELWNAAQRQLVRTGRIHNYLRMLWGKKILEWSPSPREALDWMIELNNKYAIDGRNPNSYSGIFWTLGRFDRPWGPEREIFGKIRYMSSENTARKVRVQEYLNSYAAEQNA